MRMRRARPDLTSATRSLAHTGGYPHMTLAQRLDPAHLRVSPKFTAVLAYLVGEVWTEPAITDMVVTSDGFVMLATTDDPFFDEMLGSMDDLYRNLYGVSEAVGLTSGEYATLMAAASSKVAGWR